MSRVYNFSAGPAVLPESVLKEAAYEMMDYQGSGMSVMEMSHRSKLYQSILDTAEADLRDLLNMIHEKWNGDRDLLLTQAELIITHLKKAEEYL